MRKIIAPALLLTLLLGAEHAAQAQSEGPRFQAAGPAVRAHKHRAVEQGRSVGYETWGGGYRRWNYGNFGTCTNVQLAAGMCPSYYKR